jgi:putative transposase
VCLWVARRALRRCVSGWAAPWYFVTYACGRARICTHWLLRSDFATAAIGDAIIGSVPNNRWGLTRRRAWDTVATSSTLVEIASMTDAEYRQALALFRYGVIAEFVQLPANSRGLYARLREKAKHEYRIPGSTRTKVAVETMRHWLSAYRRGGFDALVPKGRCDRGRPRALPQSVADALLTLKDEQPQLSIPQLIRAVIETGVVEADSHLPPSTVHRLLSRAGLMHKVAAEQTSADRRRFAFAHAGQLWMSDVMHAVSVGVEGQRRRKSYLIALLDDATRVVPYCAFALTENTQAFLTVFKQALLRRGIPQRLYVDNGANYRSQQLALVCAKLGIALIHARPYQPAGKGKIERWFRTVRAQFIRRLVSADTASLETLNRKLWSWVEAEYHHTPHRGLEDQTPLDRWAMSADQVRLPEPHIDLDALFLFEAKRRVQRDRTVSLNGTLFEVDAALIGHTVTLRYDPAAPPGRGVQIWHDEKCVGRATALDAYANCFVRRHRPSQGIDAHSPAPAPRNTGLVFRDLDSRKSNDEEKN